MKMNKILTAACVLAAVSTVAVGIPETKTVLADSSGNIMDSKKKQDDISFEKPGNNFDIAEDLSDGEQKELFEEYKKSGIVNKDGVLYQGYSIYFFIAHYMTVQLQCFQYYIYYFVGAYKIVFK